MSTHKHFDKICLAVCLLAVILAALFMNGEALGVAAASRAIGYEERLFDTSRVHTLDIVMHDWEGFLKDCEAEEYELCCVVIDGEAFQSVGVRAKGNTSLTSVSSIGSDRYSFKIEFDHYDSTKNYYGLDKLSLNNLIQDNTFMKDFLVYQTMGIFGVDAPLCSYVYVTVNGEDWGLYLAVEGVEDSFLQRSYGSDPGELYKPDSMSFGGGRGNGKDFDMGEFDFENMDFPDLPAMGGGNFGGMGEKREDMGSMGSNDVKLQYIDDDPDSYANIFNNAKTDLTAADKTRLIQSLKSLSQYQNAENVVNIDKVLRYFVVHNFVVNGDSYTGSMIHNYYLYEKDGRLSIIPWDYNLAFGTFQGANASGAVNQSVDEGAALSDRPMIYWIFNSKEYTDLYHQYYAQFVSDFLNSGWFTQLIDTTAALIAPYVEQDPTKFCTAEEFEVGVAVIRRFCLLRTESVSAQLAGDNTPIDTGDLNTSDMGTMSMGGKKPFDQIQSGEQGGRFPTFPDGMAPPEGAPDRKPADAPGDRSPPRSN